MADWSAMIASPVSEHHGLPSLDGAYRTLTGPGPSAATQRLGQLQRPASPPAAPVQQPLPSSCLARGLACVHAALLGATGSAQTGPKAGLSL
jgi:hypothetical protein